LSNHFNFCLNILQFVWYTTFSVTPEHTSPRYTRQHTYDVCCGVTENGYTTMRSR